MGLNLVIQGLIDREPGGGNPAPLLLCPALLSVAAGLFSLDTLAGFVYTV